MLYDPSKIMYMEKVFFYTYSYMHIECSIIFIVYAFHFCLMLYIHGHRCLKTCSLHFTGLSIWHMHFASDVSNFFHIIPVSNLLLSFI